MKLERRYVVRGGFTLDVECTPNDAFRVVQLGPPEFSAFWLDSARAGTTPASRTSPPWQQLGLAGTATCDVLARNRRRRRFGTAHGMRGDPVLEEQP